MIALLGQNSIINWGVHISYSFLPCWKMKEIFLQHFLWEADMTPGTKIHENARILYNCPGVLNSKACPHWAFRIYFINYSLFCYSHIGLAVVLLWYLWFCHLPVSPMIGRVICPVSWFSEENLRDSCWFSICSANFCFKNGSDSEQNP
jgi:hypothetical protein